MPYSLSKNLINYVKTNFNQIKSDLNNHLAETGFSLSEVQSEVNYAVKSAFLSPTAKKKMVIVQGGPGSGKSLVALNLLLSTIGLNKKAIYGLRRNGAFKKQVETVFRQHSLNSSIAFINNPRGDNGIADANFNGGNDFELIICDEAQRLLKSSFSAIMNRTKIAVFFVDDRQILNADEEGFVENYRQFAEENDYKFEFFVLPEGVRCRGGEKYMQFVEELIHNPANSESFIPLWKDQYDFKVFDNLSTMIDSLKEIQISKNKNTCLTASWTESTGDTQWSISSRTVSQINKRVSQELQSGKNLYPGFQGEIKWVMNADDYSRFWSGEGNRLDICASIYGTQGFETDYVGIILGRDLVFRSAHNNWVLGDIDSVYDTSGGTGKSLKLLVTRFGNNPNSEEYKLALKLLKNRLRIFLTRGIHGTYVYSDDKETREFLSRIVKNGKSAL